MVNTNSISLPGKESPETIRKILAAIGVAIEYPAESSNPEPKAKSPSPSPAKSKTLSPTPAKTLTTAIILERKSIIGSFVGSMKEIEEMLQFCKAKGVTSQIELIKMDYVNTAFHRLENNHVRYRVVVDVAGSQL